jgi:TetR/AcrR family transcriptional repressor of the ameABC operon
VRRPRRKAEETKADILTAAEALLRKKGFAGFSIADLAAELQMSPANVFKHFQSKTVLADAICDRHTTRMIGRFDAKDDSVPAPARLGLVARRLMDAHLADIRDNPLFFEMLAMMASTDLPSGRHYRKLIEDFFESVVRHGFETGVYKSAPESTIGRSVAPCFAGVLHHVFLIHADEAELHARCDGLVELVNAALQSPLAK